METWFLTSARGACELAQGVLLPSSSGLPPSMPLLWRSALTTRATPPPHLSGRFTTSTQPPYHLATSARTVVRAQALRSTTTRDTCGFSFLALPGLLTLAA